MRATLAAIAVLCLSCASATLPHPTLDNPIAGCYVGCAFGYSTYGSFRQQQLNCRSGRRNFLNLRITAEHDNQDDPDESLWYTGYLNAAAEGIIIKRLADRGITQISKEWATEYGAEEKKLRAEFGDSVRAAYPKRHVVLQSCDTYERVTCLGKIDNPCAATPGEPSPFGQH